MIGKDNFYFCGSSLNDISLYVKQKKALQEGACSLCSHLCIVPFNTWAFWLEVGDVLNLTHGSSKTDTIGKVVEA